MNRHPTSRVACSRRPIAQYWHKNQFGDVAGRLYIAWCAAAIGLPVLAGALFDRSGIYASTVWVAAGINVLGMLVAGRLPVRWCGPSATPRRARLNPLVDSATPGYRSASLMGCSSALTRLTPPSA